MKNIIGKPTINPIFFITGKVSGYITWILFVVQFFYNFNQISTNKIVPIISYFIFILGLVISFISILNLGSSTTLGIPTKKTEFKNKGLYKLSRNPMYLGFNLIAFSAVLHTLNIIVLILFIYSSIIYHFIILAEEKFLKKEFGDSYIHYCKTVRRYL